MNTEKQLHLFISNRMEILSEALARVTQPPLSSPFMPETIVVQSQGMQRWISLEITRHLGICANVRFLFPNDMVDEIYTAVFGRHQDITPWDREILAWRIMQLLPESVSKPGFEQIRNYLGSEHKNQQLMSYQLARRMAEVYDQYLIYRPDMIFRWEKGQDQHWQAQLWRQLKSQTTVPHRAESGKRLVKSLLRSEKTGHQRIRQYAERISVFGISSLPKFHLQVLDALSFHMEVNLFLMNPCQEYWGDILSSREMRRVTQQAGNSGTQSADLYILRGNGLLSAMGMQGRDFFDLIAEFADNPLELFQDPEDDTLLHQIQTDILHLRDREADQMQQSPLDPEDDSIQIHSCHSPMREVEVLQDRLLNLFEKNPDLKPEDILVMMPDIETYGPFIQAVFDIPREDPRWIPFHIADRSARSESQLIETFLAMLELPGSRFGAEQVLNILESSVVHQRFELTEPDLEVIRQWVKQTGIRWGIDAKNRSDLDLPDFGDNTWKSGLQRMFLGYAMPGKEERTFEGIMPFDPIEGEEAAILGKLASFTDLLFHHARAMETPRTGNQWAKYLGQIIDIFFQTDTRRIHEMDMLQSTIRALQDITHVAGYQDAISIQVIRSMLSARLSHEGFGFGFISGGVTFCAMLPMRSIPFKVICLLGMNSDAYPRQVKPVGFDLIARHPRPGDRSKRNDDRYLFLESILSARQTLHISYVGQSIRDNSVIPPSVLVSELTDYIENGFTLADKKILEDHVMYHHRLQAFSPVYFQTGEIIGSSGTSECNRLYSYSTAHCATARQLVGHRHPPQPFLTRPLPEPETQWRHLSVNMLVDFFKHPTRFFLRKRLGLYLELAEEILEEREPFSVEGLDKYELVNALTRKRLQGIPINALTSLARATGKLPHGTVGECVCSKLQEEIDHFCHRVRPFISGTPKSIQTELTIDGFQIQGTISNLYPSGYVQFRNAKIKPKDQLEAWIIHLILCATAQAGYPKTSLLMGSDGGYVFSPVSDSETVLKTLLSIYWDGLTHPIHFFPESSWIYANDVIIGKKIENILYELAKKKWEINENRSWESELSDPYVALCFENHHPLDEAFQSLSLEAFGPLINHQQAISE